MLVSWMQRQCPVLREGKKTDGKDNREKICPYKISKLPQPHLLQARYALVLLLSKSIGRPGTENYHGTVAPPGLPGASWFKLLVVYALA